MAHFFKPADSQGDKAHPLALLSRSGLIFAGALMVANCAAEPSKADTSQAPQNPLAENVVTPDAASLLTPSDSEPAAQVRYYSAQYQKNPQDSKIAFQYGRALRRSGQSANALPVFERALRSNQTDGALFAEYGKALTATGRAEEGVGHLTRAAVLKPDDWTIHSALGIAYDQLSRPDDARRSYETALELSPANPGILNNLGLSNALAGRLEEAERYLRMAVALPNASVQERQNLALVLGLAGKFEEAERLARADLPPDVAEKNVAYLKSLLEQPARWQELQRLDESTAR